MPEMKTMTVNGTVYDLRDTSAAPGGFGLGETYSRHIDNADNITTNGWYRAAAGTPDANWWLIFAHVSDNSYQIQTAYRVFDGAKRERAKLNNTWTDWVDISPSAFAPAGYGLGELMKEVSDLAASEQVKRNCFVESAYGPYESSWSVINLTTATWGHQLALDVWKHPGVIAVRKKINNTFDEWEYINPPMVPGAVYRTTKRHNGNPVYTMLYAHGKGSSSGNFHVYVNNIIGVNVVFTNIICKAEAANGWGVFLNHPVVSFAENGSGTSRVVITNGGDLSAHDIYVTVEFYYV